MIEVIAFDADDTLWHNESHFQETQAALTRILDRYAPHAEVEAQLAETEHRNIRLFGYGIKGFTLSMVETAIEISRRRVTAAEIHQIVMMGKAMLDAPLDLMDGVEQVLDSLLAADYRLLLITKGDLLDQRNKIDKSGLADRFHAVEIVSEKNSSAYRTIFAKLAVVPDSAMMVGNSLPSDVLPVLEIGGHAVHIPYHVTAVFERHDDPLEHLRFHALETLRGLPELLNRLQSG